MGTWSINPSSATEAEINPTTGKITFHKNTGANRDFIVTYDDGSGTTASTTITQLGGCS